MQLFFNADLHFLPSSGSRLFCGFRNHSTMFRMPAEKPVAGVDEGQEEGVIHSGPSPYRVMAGATRFQRERVPPRVTLDAHTRATRRQHVTSLRTPKVSGDVGAKRFTVPGSSLLLTSVTTIADRQDDNCHKALQLPGSTYSCHSSFISVR